MPYITRKQNPRYAQISLDDILFNEVDVNLIKNNDKIKEITSTITRFTNNLDPEFLANFDFEEMTNKLKEFNNTYKDLIETQDKASLYHHFSIPKRNGKWRRIDAPNEELMTALRELKGIFENDFKILYHTSAFAYVSHRCAKDVAVYHNSFKSKWYCKLDFSDFFGSVNEEWCYKMVTMNFPFSEVVKTDRGQRELRTALSLCFLNGGLPQGTPISPLLTNIVMIPIDHKISNSLRKREELDIREKKGQRNTFTYTRYSDDMQISSTRGFNVPNLIKHIESILKEFDAPMKINTEKTKYGNVNGRNWILGVMVNNQGNITVGHERKNKIKSILSNYILDYQHGNQRYLNDVQKMQGEIAYVRSIEPEYVDRLYAKYNEKYNADIKSYIKNDLNTLTQISGGAV